LGKGAGISRRREPAGEVIGARWQEFDLAERLWTVPASRMKAGKEHRVPLSDAAMAIVKQMAEIRQGDFVFAGARANSPLSSMALLMVLRRMGRHDPTRACRQLSQMIAAARWMAARKFLAVLS
jgi:integrase